MSTRRNKTVEMLRLMSEMTQEAISGTKFVEISTYLKNLIPDIEPEEIEVFRDMLVPIMNRPMSSLRYNEETGEFEEI